MRSASYRAALTAVSFCSRLSLPGLVAVLATTGLLIMGGCSDPKSTSDRLTTTEIEEIIRLLRDDPDTEDTFLNPGTRQGPDRAIPLPVWERLLGKPNARTAIMDRLYWVYQTSDGQISVWIGGSQVKGDPHYEPELFPIEWIMVDEVESSVALNPNHQMNATEVKDRILQVKQEFDKETAEIKRKAEADRIARKKAEDEARQKARLADERKETERLRNEVGAETKKAGEQDNIAKAIADEQRERQEIERRAAIELANRLFGEVAATPQLLFSSAFKVSNPVIEFVGDAKELVLAIERGKQQGDWTQVCRLMKVPVGSQLARDDIQRAANEMEAHRDDFQVLVRTEADLSKVWLNGYTRYGIHQWPASSRHPDGKGWLVPWNPMTKEGFLVPQAGTNASATFWTQHAWIDQQIADARQRAKLERTAFDERAVREMAVAEGYKRMKSQLLGNHAESTSVTQVVPSPPAPRTSGGIQTTSSQKGPDAEANHHLALNKSVSLKKPYPSVYAGAPTDKISVQYAVMLLAKQAGIPYNFQRSQQNAAPACRKWVQPEIADRPCREAIAEILRPVGLDYIIEDGKLVLRQGSK